MKVSKYSFPNLFLLLLVVQLQISKQVQCSGTAAFFFVDSRKGKITSRQSGGLAGESCLSPNSCSRASSCVRVSSGPTSCPNGGVNCICSIPKCTNDADCLSGESCETIQSGKFCLSLNSRINKRDGSLSFGSCKTIADCATDRDCFELVGGEVDFCKPNSVECSCFPLAIALCDTTADCVNGEVCATLSSRNLCVDPSIVRDSSSAEPTKGPDGENTSPKVTSTPKPVGGTATPDTTTEPIDSTSTAEPSTPTATSSSGGLTLDPCRTDKTCASDRRCIRLGNETSQSRLCNPQTDSRCLCVPPKAQDCETPKDCTTTGETCTKIGENQFCMSKRSAQILEDGGTAEIVDSTNPGDESDAEPTKVGETTEPGAEPSDSTSNTAPSTPTAPSSGGGLTLDTCRTTETCASGRSCIRSEDGTSRACNPRTDSICFCTPQTFQTCVVPEDCTTVGETCVKLDATQSCISEDAAQTLEDSGLIEIVDSEGSTNPESDPGKNTPSEPGSTTPPQPIPEVSNGPNPPTDVAPPAPTSNDDTEGVCIAAKYLSHVPREELVFDNHRLATVLCDQHGSCATSGHMVYYNGTGMMMSTYCDTIEGGCEKQRMLVNSPKWRLKLRIESNTPGMHYTAFAARYETRTEERVLRTAVRMGF